MRSDPDDVQSMVRLLLYANEFKIEGLIAASATLANIATKQHLLDMLSVYDQVDEQLRLHDRRYPVADALRKVTKEGLSGTYGKPAEQLLGEGKDSEASAFIIQLVDNPDPAPIWFCFWGGSQELAQALWRVKATRSPEQIKQFIAKLRVYLIARQDGTAGWMISEFPDLFIIENSRSFKGMAYHTPGADANLGDSTWLNAHVRINQGPLGAVYPPTAWDTKAKGVVEGDSPSFLYLYSQVLGLSDVQQPGIGGWGGRFILQQENTRHWIDAPEGTQAIIRWQQAYQADFAARLDRCILSPDSVNHPPQIMLNQDTTRQIHYLKVRPGDVVNLSAGGSSDPDGHKLSYHWYSYREAGNYQGEVTIKKNRSKKAKVIIPETASAATIHVILEVTDHAAPSLTAYRRVIIQVQ
jgi:hypothetical protein